MNIDCGSHLGKVHPTCPHCQHEAPPLEPKAFVAQPGIAISVNNRTPTTEIMHSTTTINRTELANNILINTMSENTDIAPSPCTIRFTKLIFD